MHYDHMADDSRNLAESAAEETSGARLAAELVLLREKGMRQVNNLELPLLGQLALSRYPRKSLPDAIKELLRDALLAIDERRVRDSAELLFGLRPGEMRTPGQLRDMASTAYGISLYSFTHRGHEKMILQALAQIIVAESDTAQRFPAIRPRPGAVARRSWQERLPPVANHYVQRRKLHDQLRVLIASYGRATLVGLAGFGKSRLARELAVELAEEMGTEVMWLRADSQASLVNSMSSELLVRGISHDQDENRIIREFLTYIQLAEVRPVIVIDNVESGELIEKYFPPHSRAIALVTARQRLMDEEAWPYVDVADMSIDEAIKLARAQLPTRVSAKDVADLAKALAGYPLALLHAASLLGKAGGISVKEFCGALERDAAGVFDKSTRREKALTFIYRTLLARLERDHAQAADLLKAIAVLMQNQVPEALAQRIFGAIGDYREIPLAGGYGKVEFVKAFETLEDYVIVTAAHGEIGIHQLVQALFRSLSRNGESYIADAAAAGLSQWLSSADSSTRGNTLPWLSTIIALVEKAQGRSLWGDKLIRLGDLVTMAVATAISGNDQKLLSDLRQCWLFKWIAAEGTRSEAITYLQYAWLCLSDSEYDRIALVGLPAESSAEHPLTFARKYAIARSHEWKAVYDKSLSFRPSRDGLVHLVEPIHDDIKVALEMLAMGNFHEAYKRVASALAGAALQGPANDAGRLTAYFLLVQISLRRLDISAARHYLNQAWDQLSNSTPGTQRPLQLGRAHQLAGDIEHIEYVRNKGNPSTARRHYEQAREWYRFEAIPVGRLEVERKLACLSAHSNKEHAHARLRNLLLQAKAPPHLPTYHRIRLSLAKLAILRNSVNVEDIDHCWQAADFYSASLIRDRYWYLEALVAAYCVGVSYGMPESEMSLLYEAIIHDAQSVGREDKIMLVTEIRGGTCDAPQLLTD